MATLVKSSAIASATVNLSFAGCGFLGVYQVSFFPPPNQTRAVDDMSPSENFSAAVQVGVVEAFRQQAQIVEVSKAGGSSAGALVAAAMLTGLPMESVMVQVVELKDRIL